MPRNRQASDIFVSYATEDAELCANDLIMAMFEVGITSLWVDRLAIAHGQSIPNRVDEGLRMTRHLLPIITPNYFIKPWTQMELDAVRMLSKPALPIWVNVDSRAVKAFSPTLAAQKALIYENNPYEIAEQIAANLERNKRTHFYKNKDRRESAKVFWRVAWVYVLHMMRGEDFVKSEFVKKLGQEGPDKDRFLTEMRDAIGMSPEDVQAHAAAFRKAAGELNHQITDEDIAHIIVGDAKRRGPSFSYEPRENEALKLIGVKHWR